MAFTELRKINGKSYYYRVISMRVGKKVTKQRVYLGSELSISELKKKEKKADKKPLSEKISKEIEKIKPRIIDILRKNKVKRAGIFGSYSRGEQKKNSDIDIVIEIDDKNTSLIGFIRLMRLLEEVLKRKVDLVEYSAIKSEMKERVLKDEIRII